MDQETISALWKAKHQVRSAPPAETLALVIDLLLAGAPDPEVVAAEKAKAAKAAEIAKQTE